MALPFAFRYKQIVPSAPWQQHSHEGALIPPNKWDCPSRGFQQTWHAWTAEGGVHQLTSNHRVLSESISSTSIVWCQYSQNYWIYLGDCTQLNADAEKQEDWHRMYFHDLADGNQHRGLWRILEWGNVLQHPARCPEHFEEFLPRNLFTARIPNSSCDFVGDLSLMLGLLAMCPEDSQNISEQIDRHFRWETFPRFTSTEEHGAWQPITRTKWPGRALVMQTGTVPGYTSSNLLLEDWAAGAYGPMVSAHQAAATSMSA